MRPLLEALERRLLDRFESEEKRWLAQHAAMQREVDLARVSMERRLESMNEFRAEMSRDKVMFAQRHVMEAHFLKSEGMAQQIAVNTIALARVDGQVTMLPKRVEALENLANRWWGAVLAVTAIAGVVGSIVTLGLGKMFP